MINFFKDFFNFLKLLKKNNQKKICFFNESTFTFQYLEPYIKSKSKKKKILIVSFCDLIYNDRNITSITLKTNFFRELYFLTSKNKIIYSTTPDLDNSIFKRSKFQKNKYIYLQHSSVGLVKAYNDKAFIFFDAIQTTNKFQYKDVDYINHINDLKIRKFKSKYEIIKKINLSKNSEKKLDLLIAPTWSTNFYTSNFYHFLELLIKKSFKLKVRPHPMSIKKKEININFLKKFGVEIDNSLIPDFSQTDNLISDHSGIFIEFMLNKKRKPILINTPEKNLSKKNLDIISFEKYLRDNYSIQTTFEEIIDNDFEIFKLQDELSLLNTNFEDYFF